MLAELIKNWSLWAIDHGGYFGAGVMMMFESMIAPVPSEVVMPPLGMRIHPNDGFQATWTGAILATSIGSLVGSLISYYLGYFGGKPLVMKVGKYMFINESHLDLTTRWFDRHGSAMVLICRFIPVVRHFISIPAGMARMNLFKFSLYTVIGATIWNTFLLWLGYHLEKNWESILKFRGPLDAIIIVALVVGFIAWIWLHMKKKPQKPAQPDAPAQNETSETRP